MTRGTRDESNVPNFRSCYTFESNREAYFAMTDNTPPSEHNSQDEEPEVRVRRIHRRDLNRVWEFLKLVFRDVNRETVEYQRPRSKKRFLEVYEEENVEQLVFESASQIVGYAECALEITGA